MKKSIKTHISVVPARNSFDIHRESKYKYLNQAGFVRAESAMEQWILLVNEAWNKTTFPQNEIIRDYLSFMLSRYSLQSDLFERLSTFNYLVHLLSTDNVNPDHIHDLADISLQYVAFIPGRSTWRHEPRSLRYSTELGESFYRRLAESYDGEDDWFSTAFREMARCFGIAVMVLRSTRSSIHNLGSKLRDLPTPTDTELESIIKQYLITIETSFANA